MMNTQTRSPEIARKAIQTISMSRVGSLDPAVISFVFGEAERLRPPEAILSATEMNVEDAMWEINTINSVGSIGGFMAEIDDDLRISISTLRRSYLKERVLMIVRTENPRDDYRQASLNRKASMRFQKLSLDSRNWQLNNAPMQNKEVKKPIRGEVTQ